MADEELTIFDKTKLVAGIDRKSMDDLDEEFYGLLNKTLPLNLIEVDGRIRRTLVKFIHSCPGKVLLSLIASDDEPISLIHGALTLAWLHGYMVAKKWKKSILRNPNTPRRGE